MEGRGRLLRAGRVFASWIGLMAIATALFPDSARSADSSAAATARRAAEAARRVDAALGLGPEDLAPPATDSELLRRAWLDLAGRPPARPEVEAYLADGSEGRLDALLDRLVGTPEWADLAALRTSEHLLSDFAQIRITAEGRPLSGGARDQAVAAFRRWLAGRFAAGDPWPRIVADLVAGEGAVSGEPELLYKASFFAGPPAALAMADGMSRQLLGVRISCAQCHDHPFDKWTRDDYWQLAAFATRVRASPATPGPAGTPVDDVVLFEAENGELSMPGTKRVMTPRFLTGGGRPPAGAGRMAVLASVFAESDAGRLQLARAIVNREWAWFMGRGFVDPVDDFHKENPPLAPRAFDVLVSEFEKSGYSLPFLHRVIVSTAAWRRSSAGGSGAPFSKQGVRTLTAGELLRALPTALFGWSGAPDPALPAVKALEQKLAGELRRLGGPGQPFLLTEPLPGNARQSLWLRNGETLAGLLEMPIGLSARMEVAPDGPERIETIYRSVLGRSPERGELARAEWYVKEMGGGREALVDVIWSLVNSTEFLTRH